jgi:hypothetical protein
MAKHEAPADKVGDDHEDVVAWARAKGIRVGSDGKVDAGHLKAYHDEKAYRAELGSKGQLLNP